MGRRAGLPVVYLEDGRSIYLCRFTVAGRRYRLSTGARDFQGAERAAQQLYAQASLGQLAPRRQRFEPADQAPPLDLLVARYLVAIGAQRAASYVRKQRMHLRVQFCARWERLAEITPTAIERYAVERHGQVAATTAYKELVTLSQFLKWAKRSGYLAELPEFHRPKPISDYQPPDLTAEDVAALLAELPDRAAHPKRRPVREFFSVQWAQGLRPGDVMALRWQDVDLRAGTLTIRATTDKARTGRTVGLARLARATLEALLAARSKPLPTSLIFGRCDFRVSLGAAAARAGLPHVTPHHFRHARLSELAGNTRDLAAVQYLAGHKRISTTDRYVRSRTARTVTLLEEADSVSQRGRNGGKRRTPKQARRK